MLSKPRPSFVPVVYSLLIGLTVFWVVVGPAILDPIYISWIRDGDPMQQYLGWVFFRANPWGFPIGMNDQYGIDLGASIVYSDSIPLLAIIFKSIANYLPEQFQYFGWWTLLCFLLQAMIAGRIASLMSENITLQLLITFLVTFSMPLLWRIGFHHYLLAQFLILASIYLNFSRPSLRSFIFWTLLLSISVVVNFYIFVMVMTLWISNGIDRLRVGQLTKKTLIFYVFGTGLLLGCLVWQAGYLAIGGSSSFTTGMYGESRLNLVTLFDANGWSWTIKTLLPGLKSYAGNNYESFHFLGLGLICILPLAIFIIRKNSQISQSIRFNLWRHLFLIISVIALTCFAITNWISFGSYSLHLPIPSFLYGLATTLRSSGRLFLPAYYLIVLGILYIIVNGLSVRKAQIILAIVLTVQVVDSTPGWLPKRLFLQSGHEKEKSHMLLSKLDSVLWDPLTSRYKKVITIFEAPSRGVIPEHWSAFAVLAAKHHVPTNSVYLARYDEAKLTAANAKYEAAVTSGNYDPAALYIVDDERVMPVLMHLDPHKDLFAKIDGFNVLAPGWVACSACPQSPKEAVIAKTYPQIKINEVIGFGKNQIGTAFLIGIDQRQIKGWGWAYPEKWGVWSEGSKAKVVLPIPKGSPKTLSMDFRAFITAAHPKQTLEVLVNNTPYQTVIFDQDQGNHITINLPKNDARDYIAIEFRLPDAKSPKELGIGDDIRPLGVGLTQAQFR